MTVLYDNQAFCIQEYGGLSRYFAELIAGLQQDETIRSVYSTLWTNNYYLQQKRLAERTLLAGWSFRGRRKLINELNKWHDIWQLRHRQYDLFHATYYDPYFLTHLPRQTPFVITFHDMIHEKFADRFPNLAQDVAVVNAKRKLASRASRLIAISESTKQDVVELLQVDPDKIDVVHHGNSLSLKPLPDSLVSTAGPARGRPYLLYVGMRIGYKNWSGLVNAIHPIVKQEQIQLICVGGGSFSRDEQEMLHTLGIEKWVVQQNASDFELSQLYRQAVAFIFPSLYEGFGIPILEALACGCPCLLSNSSSFPEVAGDAALYFNPDDPDSIRATLQTALSDQALRERLILQGWQRVKQFTWSAMRQKTADVYRKCV